MRINFKLPDTSDLADFLKKEKAGAFTYAPLMATRTLDNIEHYDNDFAAAKIGTGQEDFEKAKQAIRTWAMFPKEWTRILPEKTPIQVGGNVAMFASFLGLWWRNSCKIVYIIDESNGFGFAYGTLPGHIESGEELFLVRLNEANEVWYEIKAFSRPYHIFAKIGYPMVRFLQAKFRADSIEAMRTFVQQENKLD